ncbi:piggyBac transposable element-derived protein 4 isoform X1 [Neoarius graeffei]|uniref:piggyBac transposable element-derived protein 4 isoform X1 n=1 Tax=Neoarius graeffei TaxID=443677 RepID=UPI00298D4CA1|nr:piggyBac transposable element-derived protein 4 isoform X1 [Neoarius graeffei]
MTSMKRRRSDDESEKASAALNFSPAEVQELISREVQSAVERSDKMMKALMERIHEVDNEPRYDARIRKLEAHIKKVKRRGDAVFADIQKRVNLDVAQDQKHLPTSDIKTEEVIQNVTRIKSVSHSLGDLFGGKICCEMECGFDAQEALGMIQDSDDNFSSSSDLEDCDTDDERCHFELRLDPAGDQLENDDAPEEPQSTRRKRQRKARHVQATKHTGEQPVLSWKTEEDPDVAPPEIRFHPARAPGIQLSSADTHTPLNLFKLFFSEDTVMTLCQNTNKQAAKNAAKGHKYKWTAVGVSEFYKYVGLIFYMTMVKLDHIRDYWRQNCIFSVPFPATVMSRDRYRTISWNVHMSDPDEDRDNDNRRGTPEHDCLFRVKPLMDVIRNASKAFYHPRRNLAVHERTVATKVNTGVTHSMKAKPTKWDFKLFVLADSSNGYTVEFALYTGKTNVHTGQGLSYDSVMSLMTRSCLGSGYHVYMDSFYTSPKLFRDLHAQNFAACGTYRDNRKDCPRSAYNALSKRSNRGSFRWIRDGPLVFVKWMDTREVSVCSTIHAAFTGHTIQRRVKPKHGAWMTKTFPCPSPVMEYNRYMGGVHLSGQLLQYYTAQQKSMKWYRKLFLHFLDIAATNAYILHKELTSLNQQETLTHKAFLEELISQLCGVSKKTPAKQSASDHVPVPVAALNASIRKVASYGRKTCILCRMDRGKKQNTPWKCKECEVPLCLQLTRNCFEKWHKR